MSNKKYCYQCTHAEDMNTTKQCNIKCNFLGIMKGALTPACKRYITKDRTYTKQTYNYTKNITSNTDGKIIQTR